jgi:hypothetical protein
MTEAGSKAWTALGEGPAFDVTFDPPSVIADAFDQLLPYVDGRLWPKVTDETLRYGFVGYAPNGAPNPFFDALVAARSRRDEAQAEALKFIDGQEPYGGAFVTRLGDLSGPVRDFPRVAAALRGAVKPASWLKAVKVDLDALLARHGGDPGYFASPGYREAIDRIWQSYFALVMLLGYDQALLADLARSLWLAHVIDLAVAPGASKSKGVTVLDLAPGQIALLANATIVLPSEVFPLSPPSASSNGVAAGWIAPYAVGDLRMVRQRLLRYAPGEIARIETVVRGERREISNRTRRQQDSIEDVVSSVIDNGAGQTDIRAVFRWLNKIYEARLINYGRRLVLEVLTPRPAADFIARHDARTGARLAQPASPARQLGVASFRDIGPDNYAEICALYGVTEIRPPPPSQIFVTTALRAGEDRLVAIPAGYCAVAALARCVTGPSDPTPPVVLVGSRVVTPGDAATPLPPYGEEATLPVSIAPTPGANVLVNVEIQCAPAPRALDGWRIGLYAAVTRAYQEQAARHWQQVGEAGTGGSSGRSPLACRQIERRALKAACISLLVGRMATLTGAEGGGPPSLVDVDQPRYVQFLDQSLEWDKMTYGFDSDAPGGGPDDMDPGGDTLFVSFLQADQARVLLPVQPARLMSFLYFLSSGKVWDGPDALAPVDPQDVPLINDLKLSPPDGGEEQVGAAWEVVVPTAMQVLDDAPARAPDLIASGRAL